MKKFYTDKERFDAVRRYKISGLSIKEFSEKNGINRRTLTDWVRAYNNINGMFINVSKIAENEDYIVKDKDYIVNILSDDEVKRSKHFSRFDHSIVQIEYKDLKITTSLSQAEHLLKKIYL